MALCLRESILGTGKCIEPVIYDIQKYFVGSPTNDQMGYYSIYSITEKFTLKSTLL